MTPDPLRPLRDGDALPFDEAFYRGCCQRCGHRLRWEPPREDDDPTYYAGCCGLHYLMRPRAALIAVKEGPALSQARPPPSPASPPRPGRPAGPPPGPPSSL